MQVEVAGQSDIGCVRSNNEDNFGYDVRCGVFVVCDGLGGNAGGEVASKVAVDAVLAYFRDGRHSSQDDEERRGGNGLGAVAGAIHHANDAILKAEQDNRALAGMGSTIALVHLPESGDSILIGHVGDTRIYRVRRSEIESLTSDHSLVMEQVKKGILTEEQAKRSAIQNVLLKALGSEQVDPDLAEVAVLQDDKILLASDGVTRQVSEDKILECMNAPSVNESCHALIDAARVAGGEDNATCLVLSFQRRSWLRGIFGGGRRQWRNSI